ncbi:hypothetical protein HX052_12125 [Myroides marinus]|uniref:hypothetical protein n=1 Tax=Myroides marinus TaxID=703342 RepID=UPI002576B6E2|nr:hypothetical protein [Myroides marinus]MDM1369030.1 hypothetical protein [Myroides marinus]MDM1372419.1 hypothetical protein [Myroides marinus]MDM1390706.1 hypothetical protein [Myroides marinus]
MSIIDCSCKGINPSCEYCFGRGYFDDEQSESKSKIIYPIIEKDSISRNLTFEQKLDLMGLEDKQKLLKKLINLIDSKSIEQFNLLSQIYLKRRKSTLSQFEFSKQKLKFSMINQLELDKIFLRDKINIMLQSLNISKNIEFLHEFSTKKISHKSKLEVRELIKKEKKLKRYKK